MADVACRPSAGVRHGDAPRAKGRTAGAAFIAGIALAMVALPLHAHASGDDEPVRFEYTAPETCATLPRFLARLHAHTSHIRVADGDGGARAFLVRVEREGDHYRGRLTIHDRDGAEALREVRGGTCGEVTGALALIVALAVDPNASLDPAPPPDTPETSTARPAPIPTAPVPAVPAVPARPSPTAAPAVPPVTPAWTTRTGLVGALRSTLAPALAVTAGAFVEAEVVESDGAWAPSFRTSLEGMVPATLRGPRDGAAKLAWGAATVEGCPLRMTLSRAVSVRPCLHVGLGAWLARGEHVDGARSDWQPYVAPGVSARFDWALGGVFSAGASASADLLLTRPRFRLDPDVELFQPPRIGATLSGWVGVHFP